VDDQVTHLETVQLGSEVSRRVIFDTLTSLHPLAAKAFDDGLVATYTSFVIAVERSEDQADSLSSAIKPMVQSAGRAFGSTPTSATSRRSSSSWVWTPPGR
jgi:hypothetical protein